MGHPFCKEKHKVLVFKILKDFQLYLQCKFIIICLNLRRSNTSYLSNSPHLKKNMHGVFWKRSRILFFFAHPYHPVTFKHFALNTASLLVCQYFTGTKQRGLLRKTNTHLFQPFKCLPWPSPPFGVATGLYWCLMQTGEDSGIVTHLEGSVDTWLALQHAFQGLWVNAGCRPKWQVV